MVIGEWTFISVYTVCTHDAVDLDTYIILLHPFRALVYNSPPSPHHPRIKHSRQNLINVDVTLNEDHAYRTVTLTEPEPRIPPQVTAWLECKTCYTYCKRGYTRWILCSREAT